MKKFGREALERFESEMNPDTKLSPKVKSKEKPKEKAKDDL